MSDIDSNVADMNRLLKVYKTFDAESQTAKVLDAEIDRLADAIDAEAERALWMPMPLNADWLDQVDPRDPQSRTHRETAAARIAAKSVSEEVEALARRQVTGEASYWSRFMPAHSNAKLDFDGMTGDNQQAVCEGIRWVLASLADAGRLVPAGGMALTAEQVEDVRTAVWSEGDIADAAFNRLRALFPATEPGEDGWGDVNPNDPQGRTYRETAEEYYSAPAESAEEETKAEEKLVAHRDSKGDIYVGHALVAFKHRSYEQIRRWFNEAHPGGISERRYRAVLHLLNVEASSPDVPALTETGPWQTWQEVPEGVKYSPKARPPAGSPLRLLAQPLWVNRGGTRYQARSGTVSKIGDVEMFHYSPFVAAKEG